MTKITNPRYPLLVWFEHYEGCHSCRTAEASGGSCSIGAPLRFRALAAVEKIAWGETDGPRDKLPTSTKKYLELPSEAKLDIEFVLYGLDGEIGRNTSMSIDSELRRALTTIAILSFSHGTEEGMKKTEAMVVKALSEMRKPQ